ncbi:MAG: Cof-type HAD-IIB family hydrolase [Eubacteriaceae bacterium]
MEIKLIAIDMDGTTLQKDHKTISERTKKALEAAVKKGIHVVPATGRIFTQLPESVINLTGIDYAVTSNGAAVNNLKTQEILSNNYIGAGNVMKIMNSVSKKKIFIEVYSKGKSYAEHGYFSKMKGNPDFPDVLVDLLQAKSNHVDSVLEFTKNHCKEIEKLNIPALSNHDFELLWRKFSRIKGVTLTSALTNNIEVNHRTANKGEGLKQICERLKISPKNVMAIGDSGNDKKMLEFAGVSVAMGNADDKIKELATWITLDYQEDGVAHAIENLVLKPLDINRKKPDKKIKK